MNFDDELQIPEIVLERAQEIIRKNEQSPGRFFRYTSIDNLATLLNQGFIEVNGLSEFATVVSEKFNPANLAPERILPYFFLNAVHDFITPLKIFVEETDLELLENDELVISALKDTEEQLLKIDPKYTGLSLAVVESLTQKSTKPVIDYLRRVGGTKTMIELEKAGYGIQPYGAFSDLMPLSVGAPLGKPAGGKIVVLELDFDNSQIVIPDDDRNNEHEVMTTRISIDSLRGVYSEKNWNDLWEKLEQQFPDYFKDQMSDALRTFAQKKPLSELIEEMALRD